ncbi:hypothetical protein [Aquabacterium sp.]|uniref:hypothetical protein n=1 Tax=Aquabacterium sp. TaxID=1872578 RepID=UPI0040377D0C
MSKQEAEALITWGRFWNGYVWIQDDTAKRDELIGHVNKNLNAIGFKLGKGWQNYDPVIRRKGKPSSYLQIATWANSKDDKGKAMAQLFLDWATGDKAMLKDLPVQLQDLAIITHLAEVGRGYASSLDLELYPWLKAIVAGSKTWGNYNDFSPSLKYAEDNLQDWED